MTPRKQWAARRPARGPRPETSRRRATIRGCGVPSQLLVSAALRARTCVYGAQVRVCVLCARTRAHLAGLGGGAGGAEERKRSSGRIKKCLSEGIFVQRPPPTNDASEAGPSARTSRGECWKGQISHARRAHTSTRTRTHAHLASWVARPAAATVAAAAAAVVAPAGAPGPAWETLPAPPPIHLPINPLHLSLTNAPFPTPLRPGWRSSCRPASWRSAPSARPSPTLPPPSPTASPPPAAAPPPTWICGSNLRTHSTLSGSDSKLDRLRKDVTNAPDRVHDHAPLHHPDLRCY